MHALSASLVVVALLTAPNADKSDCSNIADRHSAAAAKVIEALRSYEKCVAASGPRDECASEMQALDNAHDDFADAVADAKDCK